MSLELLIYLAEVCNGLTTASILLTIFLFIVSLLTFAYSRERYLEKEDQTFFRKISVLSVSLALFFMTTAILVPSSRTIYAIAAVKMGKEISKNEKVLETSDKIYKLLNQELDKLIKVEEKK